MTLSDSERKQIWTPVSLPSVCERMIAFTIPSLESVIILSYEGLHIIDLHGKTEVRTLPQHAEDYRIYSPDANTLVFNGCIYPTLGLHGGKPIVTNPAGDVLTIDAQRQYVVLTGKTGEVVQKLPYDDYSGDWVHATFSRDRRFVLIGVPHCLYAYRVQTTAKP